MAVAALATSIFAKVDHRFSPSSFASSASSAASIVSVKLTLRPKVFPALNISASLVICSACAAIQSAEHCRNQRPQNQLVSLL
jgi:hypothetical protein